MRTVTEIKETIQENRYHLKMLRTVGSEEWIDCDPPGEEEAEGWINALEWVLDGDDFDFPKTHPLFIDEVIDDREISLSQL